ncbi:MAG: M20/M25/M40 family metallo-hydrolase [Bacteroidales bacterium]|nr:M20/M25/M40 family metallo-hydrolase [Bacteroidales bacterium]
MKSFKLLPGLVFILCNLIAYGQHADEQRLREIVSTLASDEYLGRGFGSKGGDMAAEYIIGEFRASGIEPYVDGFRQDFVHRLGILNIEGANIVGIVRGNDPALSDEYVIIGAHYDHVGWKMEENDTVVYNGADDNASGVAAITEIGRLLTETSGKPGRNVIIVAFDGEESGLIGSKAFVRDFITVEDAPIQPDKVVAMFSLDMVGMYDTHGGLELNGIELIKENRNLLSAAQEIAPVEVIKTNDKIPNRTDTAPFAAIGIPSVHTFTGTESPYHKPEDDSDLLEYEGMTLITDFLAALVGEISISEKIEKNRQMESIAEKGSYMKYFNPGVILNTGGTFFDYKNDYFRAKSVFACGAGFMFETRITQWLSIQPEVIYEWTGSQTATGNLRTHSVTVPLSLLLTTPDEGGNGFRAYYQVGGYYSYAFSGQVNAASLDFVNDYNDTDYGIVAGVGMEIMSFRIGYFYRSSLVDFTIDQQDVRLRGSFVKVGWVF